MRAIAEGNLIKVIGVKEKRRASSQRTRLPSAGPICDLVAGLLSNSAQGAALLSAAEEDATRLVASVEDPLADDDLQLALYICFELHYRSFPNVDPAWEWSPTLLSVRALLEEAFLEALEAKLGPSEPVDPNEVGDHLFRIEAGDEGSRSTS